MKEWIAVLADKSEVFCRWENLDLKQHRSLIASARDEVISRPSPEIRDTAGQMPDEIQRLKHGCLTSTVQADQTVELSEGHGKIRKGFEVLDRDRCNHDSECPQLDEKVRTAFSNSPGSQSSNKIAYLRAFSSAFFA